MKKLSLIGAAALAASLLVGGTAIAADTKPAGDKPAVSATPRPEQRGTNRLEMVAKQLNLTEDQKTKLKPIFQQETEKLRALRQDTGLTREQRQEKMKTIRDEIDPKIKAVLTESQYEQWQKMRQQRNPGRRPEGAPAARPQTPPGQATKTQ